jgi:TRAP-type uncharacterized transport system fused permease subunit
VALSGWHYYTAGFGLHNEIAHRAIHLSVVLGLCFLVFPRQKRLPGPWEWIVSIGLVAFYLLLGWGLLRELGPDVPHRRRRLFIAVLLAMAGLSLPFKAYDGSHRHIPWRDWIFARWRRASRCTCWSSSTASSSSARASTRRPT